MKKNSIQDIVRSDRVKKVEPVEDTSEVTKIPIHTENEIEKEIKIIDNFETQNSKEEENLVVLQEKSLGSPTYLPDRQANVSSRRQSYTHRGSRTKNIFVFLGIIIFFVGGYFLSLYFGHATVYIVPKVEPFNFTNKVFSTTQTAKDSFGFEVMSISDTIEKEITLTESKEFSSKAKGSVVLYNNYSTTSQKLLINTRLVDDAGKIYMTDKAVTIPGYKNVKGKVVPGSISVNITAEKAGSDYNSEPKDFTLLGFKGTAKATKIYARSSGPIEGGASGLLYTPSPEEKGVLNSEISVGMRTKLEKDVLAQVPKGYMLFPGSMNFNNTFNVDNVTSKTPLANVEVSGSVTALIINERDFEEYVIKDFYPKISESELAQVSIPELSNFTFALSKDIPVITKEISSISFYLSGDGNLLWHPNMEKIATNLVSIKKSTINTVFSSDPGILRARLLLRPPWQKTLPKNLNYIKVKLEK